MQTFGIAVALLLVTQSFSFYTPNYGTCTINCYNVVATSSSGGCGETDYACLCVNLAFITALAQCVGPKCGAAELASTASMGNQACEYDYNEACILSPEQFIQVGTAAASSQAASIGRTSAGDLRTPPYFNRKC